MTVLNYKNFLIHKFEELESTNSYAFFLAENKQIFHNEVIVANKQSNGKGRKNRNWVSVDGNLYFSLALQPKISPHISSEVSFLSAIALRNAVSFFDKNQENKIELKWPNDLLINQKKVAGILLESKFIGQECQFLIVGIGVNIKDFPANSIFQASSLFHENLKTDKESFLKIFLDEFSKIYEIWQNFGFTKIINLWLKNAYKLGEEIEVKLDEEKIRGIFVNLDKNANLILKTLDKEIKINVGDVL